MICCPKSLSNKPHVFLNCHAGTQCVFVISFSLVSVQLDLELTLAAAYNVFLKYKEKLNPGYCKGCFSFLENQSLIEYMYAPTSHMSLLRRLHDVHFGFELLSVTNFTVAI